MNMLATELIHLFLNSPLLAGKVKRNYERPVLNRLLKMKTGDVPYQLLSMQEFKARPLELFETFLLENGYTETTIEKDLVDVKSRHRLVEEYQDYLDKKDESYNPLVLTAVNKYLQSVEDNPEWLIDLRIFDHLKSEPARKTYGKAVGEFLDCVENLPTISKFLTLKRIPVQDHRERFYPSKPEPIRLTSFQYNRLFESAELLEQTLLRLTLVDGVKLDALLVSTVNHFDEANRTLMDVPLSQETTAILSRYIRATYKRGKELLFPTPKPLMVKYARRAASRAGLPEDYHSMMGLRQILSNGLA